MKKLLVSLVFIIGMMNTNFAQIVYVDILTAPAMVTYAAALKNEQEKTNDNLTAIQRGQIAVMGQLQIANDLHQRVLNGLTQVSGTLSNAMTVKEIYNSSADIVTNTKEALDLAKGNPLLLIFATKASNEFKRRALAMTTEVSRILTGGENNMMDAGERQKLLNYIYDEIRLLAATAYTVKYNMYYAKMNGIWNTLNPFNAWINNDVQIMRGVIEQAKNL